MYVRIKVAVKSCEAAWVSSTRAPQSLFDLEFIFGHCISKKIKSSIGVRFIIASAFSYTALFEVVTHG